MTMFEIYDYAQERLPIVKDWGWRKFADWFRHLERRGNAQVFVENGKIVGIGVARPVACADKAADRYHIAEDGNVAYIDLFTCEKGVNKSVFIKRLLDAVGMKQWISFKRGKKQRLVIMNMNNFLRRFEYGLV